MDIMWAFRAAYNEARNLVHDQDAFCANVASERWDLLAKNAEFPENLKYEPLVDVIRGKAKVHVHCYEAVDIDGIVRVS